MRQCVHAYQKLQPHRRIRSDEVSHDAVLSEPLFFNGQLTDAGGQPLAWEDWAMLGFVRVSHLRDLLSGPEHQPERHPPSPADSSRRSASVMETAHLVPASRGSVAGVS